MNGPPPGAPGRPPRRKRYRGTHPRTFGQKYKELTPETFPQEALKVRARGQTPAGTHVPVLLTEVIEALLPRPGQVLLDCTLGYGGHAEALAERILPGGRIIGLDLDREALRITAERLGALGIPMSLHAANFAGIGKVLREEGLEGVDMALADLGASSLQIDDPARGFSFKHDGPLDMRMDPSRGRSASQWLREVDEEDLAGILARWGDEPDAAAVATAIKADFGRGGGPETTAALARIILAAKGLAPRHRQGSPSETHPAARAFQAIRMAVNGEEENLKGLLRALPYVLRPRGRAAVIAFQDVEDRIVREAFEEGRRAGLYASPAMEPLRPTAEECRNNSRARSARVHRVVRA